MLIETIMLTPQDGKIVQRVLDKGRMLPSGDPAEVRMDVVDYYVKGLRVPCSPARRTYRRQMVQKSMGKAGKPSAKR
ncbi:MAG: hypothetical protein LBD15_01870 [Holosporales bacterium]|nr:hypothetical protein [Holosporales bacterium]